MKRKHRAYTSGMVDGVMAKGGFALKTVRIKRPSDHEVPATHNVPHQGTAEKERRMRQMQRAAERRAAD